MNRSPLLAHWTFTAAALALVAAISIGAPGGCASSPSALQVERDAVALAATGMVALDQADLAAYRAALAAAPVASFPALADAESRRLAGLKALRRAVLLAGAALEAEGPAARRAVVLGALLETFDEVLAVLSSPTGRPGSILPPIALPDAARLAAAALRAALATLPRPVDGGRLALAVSDGGAL